MKRIIALFLYIVMLTGCSSTAASIPMETPAPAELVVETATLTPDPIEVVIEETDLVEEDEMAVAPNAESSEVIAEAVESSTPAPAATPTPSTSSTPAPTAAPAPAAVSMSGGGLPFSVSEFRYDWWSIDSSDDAYWACANYINAMRRAAGLSELAVDGGLSAIANSRCEQIVSSGDFSHSGMCTAGEILGENYNSASSVCSAWQASPSHYNQITGGYSSMGIGCVFEQGGQTVWCVVFS